MGDNSKGQASPPAGYYGYLVAGGDVTCATSGGQANVNDRDFVCWGDNSHGVASPPSNVYYVTALGPRHGCGLDMTRTTSICWGDNTFGQTTVPPGDVRAMAVGRNHTCGIKLVTTADLQSNHIVCWGDNSLGQATPPDVFVPSGSRMAAAGDRTCFLGVAGGIVCWGDQAGGRSAPPWGNFDSFAVAAGHACALEHFSNTISCCGDDWGDTNPIPPPGRFISVLGGEFFFCATPFTDPYDWTCWGPTYQTVK